MPAVDTLSITDTNNKLRLVINELVGIINNDVVVANLPISGNVVTTGSMGANNASFTTAEAATLTANNSTITNLTANSAVITTANIVSAVTRTLTANLVAANNITGNTANIVSGTVTNFFSNNIVANNLTANNRVTANVVVANTINVASITITTAFNFMGDLSINNVLVANAATAKSVTTQTITANGAVSFTGVVTANSVLLNADATNANGVVRKSQFDAAVGLKANSNNGSFTGVVTVTGNVVATRVAADFGNFNALTISTTGVFGGTLIANSGIVSGGDIVARRGSTNVGYYYFGNGTHSIGYDGSVIQISTAARIAGNLTTSGGSTYQTDGNIYMAWAGKYLSAVLSEKAPTWQPTFTGDIVRVSGGTPRYEFLWGGAWRRDIRMSSTGELQFVSTDHGAVTHTFGNGGHIWTSSIGNVGDEINNAKNIANDRVHRVAFGAYGEMSTHNPYAGGDYWLPSACVPVKFLTNVYGGVQIVGYRKLVQHVPSLGGWVDFYQI